ncbi:hypothetical protein SAMN02927914_03753 [Mesorhizobium qingshengii]|uniref:Uncharacterized protein n=1 Tax=Mesorhizobium qingshengii TaxID=1165689 RepID=A0A1G5YU91_9HYPH|nr:hypothetical protein SAMN02927914_03753 [Mesorhizobium qingshengii]
MTLPSPMLASAFVLAVASALALRSMVVNAGRRWLVWVRGERNRRTDTKTQG